MPPIVRHGFFIANPEPKMIDRRDEVWRRAKVGLSLCATEPMYR